MILPRDGAAQPGGNVDPQDILATFLTKETKRDVRPPVNMKSDPCAQYPWDYLNQFGKPTPNTIYDYSTL